MEDEKEILPLSAGIFLMAVGGFFDLLQLGALLFFGLGLAINSLLITPIAGVIFWVVLWKNDVPMWSGKRAFAGWVTGGIELLGIGFNGFLPTWFLYALYLTAMPRVLQRLRGIIEGWGEA